MVKKHNLYNAQFFEIVDIYDSWPRIWSVLVNVPYMYENNVYFTVSG